MSVRVKSKCNVGNRRTLAFQMHWQIDFKIIAAQGLKNPNKIQKIQ